MTRTATTKLVATALAIASLGIAGTAQADEGQGIAIGEPTPGQPVPAQTPDQGAPAQAPTDENAEEAAPEKTQEQQDLDRFNRYCHMKDAEPSHSDKKFCEDYRNSHGAGTSSTSKSPTQEEKDRYNRYCNMKDAEPSHSDKEFCEWYRKQYPTTTSTGGYDKPSYGENAPKPAEQADKADKGSLPFTGLEIWQLGLIGIVLAGGGIGARRLLTS